MHAKESIAVSLPLVMIDRKNEFVPWLSFYFRFIYNAANKT